MKSVLSDRNEINTESEKLKKYKKIPEIYVC